MNHATLLKEIKDKGKTIPDLPIGFKTFFIFIKHEKEKGIEIEKVSKNNYKE